MTVQQVSALQIVPSRGWLPGIVAMLAVAVTVLVVVAHGPGAYRLFLASGYLLTLAWLGVHDIRTLTAPNRVVFPALAFAIALSIPLGTHDLIEALLGGFIGFGILLVIAIVGRGAMGFGDVKVGGIAGLAAGLHGVLMMLIWTFAAGGLLAAVLLLFRVRQRKDVVAFTPLLAISVAVCFVTASSYLVR
jgi:Flp pilus assembly protein protease CpaA